MSYVNFGIPLFHTHQHLSLIYRWNVLYTIWFHHIFQELASNAIYWRFLTTNNFFLKENYSRKSNDQAIQRIADFLLRNTHLRNLLRQNLEYVCQILRPLFFNGIFSRLPCFFWELVNSNLTYQVFSFQHLNSATNQKSTEDYIEQKIPLSKVHQIGKGVCLFWKRQKILYALYCG